MIQPKTGAKSTENRIECVNPLCIDSAVTVSVK